MAKDLAKAVRDAAQGLADAIVEAEAAGYIVSPKTVTNALPLMTVSSGAKAQAADEAAAKAAEEAAVKADKGKAAAAA